VAGDGDGVVLTDKVCFGKAILIAAGTDVTVRNLTLARARVPDRNGAGIRAEGHNLSVENVRFVDNEDGLLAASVPGSTLRIAGSVFERNGSCAERRCGNALTVGEIATLRVTDTRFGDARGGRAVESQAARTELVGDELSDAPDGVAGALVGLPEGGDLLVQDCRFRLGPRTAAPRTAVLVGESGGGPAGARQVIARNRLTVEGGVPATLLLNWGDARPALADNVVPAGAEAESTRGALWNRLHGELYTMKLTAERAAGLAKRLLARVLARG
ncbi:MAG: hypothetical protein JO326_05780, partial [Acetobacteraceae bacterium]|nr:hypothetical protein [Acetobacteraceae bacterium]